LSIKLAIALFYYDRGPALTTRLPEVAYINERTLDGATLMII